MAEQPLSASELRSIDSYWRAANYLSAAQIYLKENCLLREPLTSHHIKNRLLGHWGTAPGINFVYAHLNQLIKRHGIHVLLVTGPGHGAAANLANLYLEGTLQEYYPELTRDLHGAIRFITRFSSPRGFPSHLDPTVPGTIHEGGELGYALAKSFGAVFDNPDLICACIVGDGEAETGPTATAWHSAKFLNPAEDGAVIPILHLNRYKISSESIFGAMSDEDLLSLFRGYGYAPIIIEAHGETLHERIESHQAMSKALEDSYIAIKHLQSEARSRQRYLRPTWPMIVLRSAKGWTGPAEVDGKAIAGSCRSHQVPAADCKMNAEHLRIVEEWLLSYQPRELFDSEGKPFSEILAACPTQHYRMGMNKHALGGELRRELILPDFHPYCVNVTQPGATDSSDMAVLGNYLRDVVRLNDHTKNIRFFCPDEMTSNKLGSVFDSTTRQFAWPTNPHDDAISRSGRVLEILSEHTCQGWLEGYLLTGRHGLFPCYEAFASIVDSMVNQYAKFLKVASDVPWRKPWTSLTYLLSSEGWRQDHNGYSHQGPGFINNLLTKKARHVRIYLPPDANCLLSTVDHCLKSLGKINLIIASKQKMPQWLPMREAEEHCRRGASIWEWAGNDHSTPDVVLAGAGVYPTTEVLAAAWLLKRDLPELSVRVVNVTDLLILEPDSFHPHGLTPAAFDELFTPDKPVIFNFHGYPQALKELLFDRPLNHRFDIHGYIEEGTTTTPFDLLIRNGASRYDLVISALRAVAQRDAKWQKAADEIREHYTLKMREHRAYIEEHGIDPDEILDWRWGNVSTP